ncbi:haloacid dehalogenase-like hydrolase [Pikeienuella piscinae]|uniref:Haloacid dehalogenase-like hydrolase n=1 Tax=Pikeienuella piscinae TaxID=2748098 RepID=A0A7L5BZ40_9RHOB|nr:HAD family hydrolase [Pikeienuella piscinae]QIE55154.1 haloacid dehalogenase-like hydrolase [Pikeienuella piscinae]
MIFSTDHLRTLCAAATIAGAAAVAHAQEDPLPSWNDGETKSAIVAFVEAVSEEGGPDFVPVPERVATFDNDGTLWAEQPMYTQLAFAIDRVKALADQNPDWKTTEPYSSILKGDIAKAFPNGVKDVLKVVLATHSGLTSDQYAAVVRDWLETSRHPAKGAAYTKMVYQPMLELLAYLRSNDFKTFIVSGGGIDFMRVFTEEVYGVPPEQVMGSSAKLKFDIVDGAPVLLKQPEMDFIDDGPGKPVGIGTHIGRKPIAAFGNSDGDLQMLQYTCLPPGPSFCLYVHHTDAKREWAYDRKATFGKLDKGLDAAASHGWTVVDMAKDWRVVFPD